MGAGAIGLGVGTMGIYCGCGTEIVAKNPQYQRLMDRGLIDWCGKCDTGKPTRGKFTEQQYQEYLESDWWQTRRLRALELAGYKCQVSGSREYLEVHHNCYDRLGGELDSDLIVLSRECHRLFHAAMGLAY